MFSDLMHGDVTTGSMLDDAVAADMIAMAMGADDLPDVLKVDPYRFNELFGDVEVGNIPGVNEHRMFGATHKMIAVEVSPFDKEKVFHDLLNRHVSLLMATQTSFDRQSTIINRQ